ncbi:MAG TPA: OmpH family outer membrane protein [Phycisphaerae bacterium]|nr:OmpH family outer membrane protein [Phycisphaerae bacterium]HPS53804.1 OmpH family outer membrane protein [Phycisphaerae bacterium]
MNVSRRELMVFGLLAALAVCVMSLTNTVAQSSPAKVGPTSVAVCNIMEIFTKYNRATDLMKELEKKQQAIQSENEKKTKAIEAAQQELGSYNPGKPEYQRVQEKIKRLAIERQVWLRMQENSLLEEHLNLTKDMYEEVRKAVAAVAKYNGVDIVLQIEPNDFSVENATQMVNLISTRKVVYSADRLDLTPSVLQYLNMAYRAKP